MAIQWNQVKSDFSGSSSSMKNAMTGISQAGTVFDKMHQTILDEEQRAIENAYKESQLQLDKDKLAEDVRQFSITNQLNLDKLAEEQRANKALEQYRAAQLADTAWKRNNDKLYADAEKDFFNKSHELDTTVLSTKKAFDDFKKLNPSDTSSEAYKTLEAAFNKAQAERASLPTTANEAKLYIMRDARNRGYTGTGAVNSIFDPYVQYEVDKATKAAATAVTKAKDRETAITKKSEAIGKEAWDSNEEAGRAQAALAGAAKSYPDMDINLIEGLLRQYTGTAWLGFGSDKTFSESDYNAFKETLKKLHSEAKTTGTDVNTVLLNAVAQSTPTQGLSNLPLSIKDGGNIPESTINWTDITANGFVNPEAYGKSLNKPASFFGFTAR